MVGRRKRLGRVCSDGERKKASETIKNDLHFACVRQHVL